MEQQKQALIDQVNESFVDLISFVVRAILGGVEHFLAKRKNI